MTIRDRYRPFTGDSELRVQLERAPLALVLCQIQWPRLNSLQTGFEEAAVTFGQNLNDFPLFSSNISSQPGLIPGNGSFAASSATYQWETVDRKTAVTLGETFVTLATTAYTDFKSFYDQLAEVIRAVQSTLQVPIIERIGYRYVNQLTQPAHRDSIADLVRPEILGYQMLRAASPEVELQQAITQGLYAVGNGFLHVRSGILGPDDTMDPMIPPVGAPSWILDIDSFLQTNSSFDAESLLGSISQLADAAYDFFKLVVNEAFITTFGGEEDGNHSSAPEGTAH